MSLTDRFEVAGGSVRGRRHALADANNQDAFCWSAGPDVLVAVVADGCGSGSSSETGAGIGARLMAEALSQAARPFADGEPSAVLERASARVVRRLGVLARAMGGSLARTVHDHFLFTLAGAVIGPERGFAFLFGDGVVAVNGDVRTVTFPENRPPYLGYRLLGPREETLAPSQFTLVSAQSTAAIDSVLLGTDGVADLIESSKRPLPGSREPVGPLLQFWTEDRYFRNPFGIGRRLRQMNREVVRRDVAGVRREPGLLPDDTTLVVLRRRNGEAAR